MFKPLNDRVIVKRDEARSVSEGGIIIPEQAKEQPVKGTVFRVGTGEKMNDGSHIPPIVTEGDRIIFAKFGGIKVLPEEDGDFMLIRECDIMCVMEEE